MQSSRRQSTWLIYLGARSTYCMNILQHVSEKLYGPVLVTLNPPSQIDPDSILGEYAYEHPLFSKQASDLPTTATMTLPDWNCRCRALHRNRDCTRSKTSAVSHGVEHVRLPPSYRMLIYRLIHFFFFLKKKTQGHATASTKTASPQVSSLPRRWAHNVHSKSRQPAET